MFLDRGRQSAYDRARDERLRRDEPETFTDYKPIDLGATGPRAVPMAVCRVSRLDLMRALAADVVERLQTATQQEHASLVIQLRGVQDEIGRVKHRHPLLAARPSALAWVDGWSPER